MRKLNNNGFTLIELLITIVILSLVLSVAGYSVVTIIKSSKEKNYELLIEDIKSAAEMYYQECYYLNSDKTVEDIEDGEVGCVRQDSYEITLRVLLEYGFLSSSVNNEFSIISPKDDKEISNCKIKITRNDGKITVTKVDTGNSSCPTSY